MLLQRSQALEAELYLPEGGTNLVTLWITCVSRKAVGEQERVSCLRIGRSGGEPKCRIRGQQMFLPGRRGVGRRVKGGEFWGRKRTISRMVNDSQDGADGSGEAEDGVAGNESRCADYGGDRRRGEVGVLVGC